MKGVGPRLGAIFNARGVHTIRDLMTFFPRAYEDRSKLLRIADVEDGSIATLSVQVLGMRKIPTRTPGRSLLEVRVTDQSGVMALKWFHAPRGMESRFQAGTQIVVTGTVKSFMGRPEILHPEITWGMSAAAAPLLPGDESEKSDNANFGRVIPVYTEVEGVPSRQLRKVLWEALEKHSSELTEDLPERFLSAHQLPKLADAIRSIHFPPEAADTDQITGRKTASGAGKDNATRIQDLMEFNTPAHWRLIYEEFFKFEFLVLRRKLKMEREAAPSIGADGGRKAVDDLIAALPFKLTGDQKKAIDDILKDIALPQPMNRLIQGDVGSGKTAVAFLSAGAVLAEGGQAALMAPTEILAEQHYKNAIKLFGGRLNVGLLTGKTPTSERNLLFAKLKAGQPILLIGTHALLEDPVEFSNLVFVMVDEQHRFGVEQRRTLRRKGSRLAENGKTIFPHTLVLTATPIPRTLSLTVYGDLTVSTIREMPPGRSPIITKVIRGDARLLAYEQIRDELRKGHQAYFIYPLVNESEAEGFTSLRSAVVEAERLGTEIFPDYKVGLLHGQLRPDEKTTVMDQYKRNELQILVSTTVVEVGVDVPNATVIAIEHSERFGLSQLHQLRGRVGRGQAQSYCYFFSAKKTGEVTAQRLEVLEETNDGFKIAEADLEIRGPGEFLGTRQAGSLPFRLADLVRDKEWLVRAREDAQRLLQEDPDLRAPENQALRSFYQREGAAQAERLKTS